MSDENFKRALEYVEKSRQEREKEVSKSVREMADLSSRLHKAKMQAELEGLKKPDAAPKIPQGKWLTIDEAAAYARMVKEQIYQAVHAGQLKCGYGPKNALRFTREMLDDYLAERKGNEGPRKRRNPKPPTRKKKDGP